MTAAFQLAQVNLGRLRAPLDSPAMRPLAAEIDRLNLLADRSPGFAWRLDAAHLVGLVDTNRLRFVNVSVWESYEHLHLYVYRSAHGRLVRERNRWFVPGVRPATALWWVPAGARPTLEDALRHLELPAPLWPDPAGLHRAPAVHPGWGGCDPRCAEAA